jgi:hypothetical protein
MEAAAGLGLFETLTEGRGLTTPFEELVLQDLALAQEVLVLQHVGAVSVNVSKHSVVPELVQRDVYFYSTRVASVEDP